VLDKLLMNLFVPSSSLRAQRSIIKATQAAEKEETNLLRLLFKSGTLPQQIADAIQEVRKKFLDGNIST
jgi:hypothetical protein